MARGLAKPAFPRRRHAGKFRSGCFRSLPNDQLVVFDVTKREVASRNPAESALAEGWVFSNRNGKPLEMGGFCKRVIMPVLKAKGIVWKGLYAGRRAAGTLLTQLTGDALAASYVLRHKNLATTTAFYIKPVRSAAEAGMKAVEETLAKRLAERSKPKALFANAGEAANGSEKEQ